MWVLGTRVLWKEKTPAEPSLRVLRLASFDTDSSHAPLNPVVTAAQRAEALPRPRWNNWNVCLGLPDSSVLPSAGAGPGLRGLSAPAWVRKPTWFPRGEPQKSGLPCRSSTHAGQTWICTRAIHIFRGAHGRFYHWSGLGAQLGVKPCVGCSPLAAAVTKEFSAGRGCFP